MRILQLIYESYGSPFGFGGAGVRACEIYNRLKDRHDITLLCMAYPGARDGLIEGLTHKFAGTGSKSLTKSVLSYTVQSSLFVKKHGGEYDVIVENFLPSTPFFSKLLTKTPVVLQVQGIMEHHSIKKFNPLYSIPMYAVESFYPALYDTLMFVSDVTRDKVMSRRGMKGCTHTVIPNGIDARLLYITPDASRSENKYILFFSRIDIYTKGLDLLVAAFREINRHFPNMKLILAGYEFDKADALIASVPSAVAEKIEYAGFVTGPAKKSLLGNAMIFVLPSRHESSPVSILEAAACAVPVVTSDIGELSFVARNHIGLSFKSGNRADLAAVLLKLIRDAATRVSLGENGRDYARGFLWDEIAVSFEKQLLSVAGNQMSGHENALKKQGEVPTVKLTNDEILKSFKDKAAPFRNVKLTPQSWKAEFGENQVVDTPVGDVKIGNNQYLKLKGKNREQYFGLIKPTLSDPLYVVEVRDHKEGAERDSKRIYIKPFVDKNKNTYFTSITVQKNGKEISISSHPKESAPLIKIIKEGRIKEGRVLYSTAAREIYTAASMLHEHPAEAGRLLDTSTLPQTTEPVKGKNEPEEDAFLKTARMINHSGQ
ncbi:MAG: glycosyltransferase [Nitrospirae bacterium]|nr:glycosyltransferase [Nitrospirota bacterium]